MANKSVPLTAKAVANYFLDIAKREKASITSMKLQKLVYVSHGWFLALVDLPLINEPVEAWQYGPVIPSLYQEFKEYGKTPIDKPAVDYEMVAGTIRLVEPSVDEVKGISLLLDKVWDAYGGLSAYQLSNMTHEPDTPWDQVWNGSDGSKVRGLDIPDEVISRHFKQLRKHQD